jgi:glycosidase
MIKLRLLLISLLIAFALTTCRLDSPKSIRDLIPMVTLVSGQSDTLLVSDLFYAEDYDLEFLPHPDIQTRYNRENRELLLSTETGFEGLTLLGFKFKGRVYQVPVRAEILQTFTFRYRPEGIPQKLTLFGSFNSWNRNNLPLTDEDGDGVYEISISLEAGRFEYKFFLDGEEIIDPENPDKVANSFGGYNSLITVSPRHSGKAYLHILGADIVPGETKLSFIYEGSGGFPAGTNQPEPLIGQQLVTLLDNQKLPGDYIRIHGNRVDIILNGAALKGEKILRVAVSGNGLSTLFQAVRLVDGQPAGTNNTPFAWHDGILYSIMIDRFYDGDPANTRPIEHPELSPKANFMGGDLQGIIDKLEEGYFDSLGINTLWLSPINQNTPNAYREWPEPHRYFSAYHGYWPIHHQKVDERFGNLELLKTLAGKAYDKGIRVLLDFVANHTHIDHPFFKEHRNWYGVLELPDGRKNIRFWDEYRLTTWFEPFLPSFDYSGSEEALQTMTDNAVWWLKEADLDGFRHDAVKHIPNRFWRELTRKIKREIDIPEERKTYQIGETFGSYDLISSYVNNGQLDAQFNFNLYFTARQVFLTPEASFQILADELQKTFSVYGMNHLMGNLMDSHDQVRYMTYTDGDISLGDGNSAEIGWNDPPQVDHEESYRKALLYQAYLFTTPGVPTLYYGDEIGMTGAADPDNRRMMRFDMNLNPAEKSMLRDIKKLVQLRRRHSALRYGDFQTLYADENCFAYLRSDFNQRILVALNKSSQPQTIQLTIPVFYDTKKIRDVTTARETDVVDNRIIINISPTGWAFYRLE